MNTQIAKFIRTLKTNLLQLPNLLLASKWQPLLFGIISGFSVFYFLYFLQAYGIQKGSSYSGHSHFFRSISFGILTSIYLTVLEHWLRPKINLNSSIFLILWYIGLVFLGSQLIFLLFNFFWNWQEWNREAYFLIVKEFPLIMILPLALYLSLKKYSGPRNTDISYLSFKSENGKDTLKVTLKNFLYANSSDNYIAISYYSEGEIKKHLIRKPLKVLEEELKEFPEIKRTHRSYLVNRLNIDSIKQSKGKILLEIRESILPVSKQYQNHFIN